MGTKNKTTPKLICEGRASSRGPKPGLNTTQIARAAIRIADAEGLEAVTMQRVARAVGVTTMALYRYFPGKADLVAIMIDTAGGSAPDFANQSLPWKDRLRKWAHCCASIYRNHPWFLEATTVRHSSVGPNELSWMEAALAMLAEAGLSPKECHHSFLAVIGHVRGHTMFEPIKHYGQSPRQWIRDLNRLVQSEERRYPALQVVLASGAFSSSSDTAFDFGLNCILDGISARVRARSLKARKAN